MGDGSSGGAGAGYNIPISVSYARSESVNPILNASTTFNFSSPWASGGSNDQTSRLTTAATATSSAAEGNAAAATQAPIDTSGGGAPAGFSLSSIPWYAWAGAIAVIGLLIYRKR